MTINNQAAKTIALGDGVTNPFNYSFLIPNGTGVIVVLSDAAGNITVIPPSQYAITGIGNPTGGTVTYPLIGSPLAIGMKLTIARALPYVQLSSITNQGANYPNVVEAALDYVTMLVQQLLATAGLSLQVPINENALGLLPPVSVRAGNILIFDVNGNPTVVAPGQLLQDPTTTLGDLIYRGTNALSRIGIGAARTVLSPVGGIPGWLANAAWTDLDTQWAARVAGRAPVALTDAATVAFDMSQGNAFTLTATSLIGNSRILGAPTNMKPGDSGVFRFIQDATGSRSFVAGIANKHYWGGQSQPAGSTAANAVDLYGYSIRDANHVDWAQIALNLGT